MDEEINSYINRRKFLSSVGAPAGLYATAGRTWGGPVDASSPNSATVDMNEVITKFGENIFAKVLSKLGDQALGTIADVVDRIGRGVASGVEHVGELVDDVIWIKDNANALWNAVQDAMDAAEENEDEADEGSDGEGENSSAIRTGTPRQYAQMGSGMPRQYAQKRTYESGAKLAELGWPDVDVEIDVDVPDLPDLDELGDEYENLEEHLEGAYDEFQDRFGGIPSIDDLMGWVEEAYGTVADWFMELVPDLTLPDSWEEFASMFPLEFTVDFDTFDFQDLFDIEGTHEISLPWSIPEDAVNADGFSAASTDEGSSFLGSGLLGAGSGNLGFGRRTQERDETLNAIADDAPHIELENCPNLRVPGPVKAFPMEFDWAEGLEGDIPGPCGDEAAPSASIWVGWHEATPNCVYTGYDASQGCSVTPRDVAEYAQQYEEELESLSEEFLDRIADLVDTVNDVTEQPEVVVDEAIEDVETVESAIEDLDGYMDGVPVDPLGIEGKIEDLLEDDELSPGEDELGHTDDEPVGGLERLRLVLGDVRDRLEAFDPDLPHDRVDEFTDDLRDTDVDYDFSQLEDLRDEIDEKVVENAERDGTMQFELADVIDDDTEAMARLLYELAREHRTIEENTPFTTEDIEQAAEAYEAFQPVEVDVSQELEEVYGYVVDRVVAELEGILNEYAAFEYDFTDPYPDILCRRFCDSSGRPQPVPSPDAAYIADEAAKQAMERARNPQGDGGSGGGDGGFFEPILDLPSIIWWILGAAIILLVVIAVAVYWFGLGVVTVGSGGTASPATGPAAVLGFVLLTGTIAFVQAELWGDGPAA